MDNTVKVRFPRDLVTALLIEEDAQTLRMSSLGEPDEDGFYDPSFVREEMVPSLPEPWTFDGYRRIYDDGKPTALWQARAVDLTDIEIEEETGREKANFTGGQGRSMVEARDALLEVFK